MTGDEKKSQRVLITGPTSAIARSIARVCAARGDSIVLAGRDAEEAERLAVDLRLAYGVKAFTIEFDGERELAGTAVVGGAVEVLGGLDRVYSVHGAMWDQARVDAEPGLAGRLAAVNLGSVSEIARASAGHMSEHGGGTVCLVSSVAGDRGRASNAAYGASKAGVNALAEGLRGRVVGRGVRVVLIKPGFVDTSMTWGQEGMFLVASPGAVARRIVRAADRGERVVYTPWFWRWIMLVIRLIPRPMFDRMGL